MVVDNVDSEVSLVWRASGCVEKKCSEVGLKPLTKAGTKAGTAHHKEQDLWRGGQGFGGGLLRVFQITVAGAEAQNPMYRWSLCALG